MKGWHALVTGVSSGLGQAIADHLLESGATVCGISRRGAEIAHGHYNDYLLDIGVETQLEEALGEMQQDAGPLDLVVHCAGVLTMEPLLEMPTRDFEQILRTNLLGSFHLLKHLPNSLNENNAHVVVLSGQGADKPLPNMGAYSASQAGLHRLIEEFRREYKEIGARVSLLTLGAVDTPIWEKFDISDRGRMLSIEDFLEVFSMIVASPPSVQFNDVSIQHINGFYGF
jgi:2,3-dihydro-2,3-dihydroxybenzoate dehydrogenase